MSKFNYNYNKNVKHSVKSLYIPVDIYRCHVSILMPKETERLCKDWGTEVDFSACTDNFLDKHREVLIRLTRISDSDLVHELVHAAQMIMYSRGHNHCKEKADEPFAYLVGYLFEQAKIKIKEYKKKPLDKKKQA